MKVYKSEKIEDIVNQIDENKLKGKVGIKVHFGEKGNETYLDPKIVEAVYDKVVDLGYEAALLECNVLYKGSRTNKSDHIETAKEHGFDFAPIDILDGEKGDDDIELPVEDGKVNTAKVGEGLKKYDSLIVLSHFKGHAASGFGAAFKNLGMGLGSRAGKLHMHSDVSPSIDKGKCTKCGVCIENCDVDAIRMTSESAEIDSEKCIGCAMCIAVCEFGAVSVPWGGSTNKELQEKIVDYSHAIIDYFDENLVYINVLKNITKDCDCVGRKMDPIMDDVGMLLSNDPVAIDKASLDLVNKKSGDEFNKINSTDNDHKIDYAHKKKLGNKNYQIKNL
ncbi:MAG: DUF362 domain-containing protein [Patescibacteria group bacterium]